MLPAGWDAVIEKDIDGDRSETVELETKETRFGQVGAARRVARTIFLGSAPSSVASTATTRGLDAARIRLGCLQPGQSASLYTDALNRLADRLHYLNSSGDKDQDTTRFWFDTRANLRREMEDRKRRFDLKTEVRGKIAEALKKVVSQGGFFDGVHLFTPHADVPDDSALRLILLPPEQWYAREETRIATDAVLEAVQKHGAKPRYRGNRLLFLAPDHGVMSRLNDVAATLLAWGSIVEDAKEGRLTIDNLQQRQAEKELKGIQEVLPRAARECYKWLLCPFQEQPTDPKPTVEAFALNTSGGSLGSEIERVCVDNELVISTWSPIHLRTQLQELYWKGEQTVASAEGFFEDSLRYLYLPRFRSRNVLEQAIRTGAASRDFFGTAYGQSGESFEGFKFGEGNVVFDDTLLLIEPGAAKAYEAAHKAPPRVPDPIDEGDGDRVRDKDDGQGTINQVIPGPGLTTTPDKKPPQPTPDPQTAKPKSFHASVEVPTATAKMRLVQLADEIVSVLSSDPNASVRLVVEISAEFPEGASDTVKRAVSENANSLSIQHAEWE